MALFTRRCINGHVLKRKGWRATSGLSSCYREIFRKVCDRAKKYVILQAKFHKLRNMSIETKREYRFYSCLVCGYALMLGGFFAPPIGIISNSVIIGAGLLLCMGAMCVGVDLKGCIHELRLLKEDSVQEMKGEEKCETLTK